MFIFKKKVPITIRTRLNDLWMWMWILSWWSIGVNLVSLSLLNASLTHFSFLFFLSSFIFYKRNTWIPVIDWRKIKDMINSIMRSYKQNAISFQLSFLKEKDCCGRCYLSYFFFVNKSLRTEYLSKSSYAYVFGFK